MRKRKKVGENKVNKYLLCGRRNRDDLPTKEVDR
jgi:hypothetical protein